MIAALNYPGFIALYHQRLVGSTAAEAIAALGPPQLAVSHPDPGVAPLEGEPGWARMDEAARRTVLARPRVTLAYPPRLLGSRLIVTVENGRVTRVADVAK